MLARVKRARLVLKEPEDERHRGQRLLTATHQLHGTDALAQALTTATTPAVVGGGDTVAALSKFSFDHSRVFLSTGGGAMLEFLTSGTLPALELLKKQSTGCVLKLD